MPLQLTFASVIFLLVHCFFFFFFLALSPPLYTGVCAHACAVLFGVCVADHPAVP